MSKQKIEVEVPEGFEVVLDGEVYPYTDAYGIKRILAHYILCRKTRKVIVFVPDENGYYIVNKWDCPFNPPMVPFDPGEPSDFNTQRYRSEEREESY